jgi:predicted small secreted protein
METPASIDERNWRRQRTKSSDCLFRNASIYPRANAFKEEGNEMKRLSILLLLAGATITGCTPTQQGAGIGAASGAVIGGVATGNVRGAAVGAAIGGAAGAVIGNVAGQPGQCYYRDRYGRRYVANCPR